MAKFKYRAMNVKSEKVEGEYNAKNRDEVISFITSNGLYPLRVEEIIESGQVEFHVTGKVKVRDISIFCRQFYTMLQAGVPILECVNILSHQIANKKLRDATADIEEHVRKGINLSEAMKDHTDVFPELLITLVESGEASGRLDSVFLRMSTYFEKSAKTRSKVINAMIYPIVLSIVAFAAVAVILIFVMPTFAEMFEEAGQQLPWNTKILLNISKFLGSFWYIVIILILGAIFGIHYYKKTEKGKQTFSILAFKFPVIDTLNLKTISSQFTRTMSMLLASGIPLIHSLSIVTDVVSNTVAKDALKKVTEKVTRGESIYSSMVSTKLFPPMLTSMVKIGEETGILDDILNKTADFYDEELDA